MENSLQKATPNNSLALIEVRSEFPDSLTRWAEAYFQFEVTTSESSRREQKRDLKLFLDYLLVECGRDDRTLWTPRLSKGFQDWLKKENAGQSKKRYGDRTVNRIVAHLKTFAKWVHKLRPFPLGSPMEKIKLLPVGTGLEVERAITPTERRRLLDAADTLPLTGGRSRDRHRFRGQERPQRKGFRPWRNRAIVYALIETGLRRAAIRNLDLVDVDTKSRTVTALEKGGHRHTCKITHEGLAAITEYVERERGLDNEKWRSASLFLASATTPHGDGRLNTRVINTVWSEVCRLAGVEGRTPHSARHAMGKHIIEKTGNIAAVQRQLGHKNAVYSMQYAGITDEELLKVIEDRRTPDSLH